MAGEHPIDSGPEDERFGPEGIGYEDDHISAEERDHDDLEVEHAFGAGEVHPEAAADAVRTEEREARP